MAGSDEALSEFVAKALEQGSSREEITSVLERAGWPSDDVAKALGAYAEVDFPIPVPRPRPYLSAREAFIYLVIFVTLGISAFQFGVLCFEFIERMFPDPVAFGFGEYSADRVRYAIASLVVAFPIYLVLSIRVNRTLQREPAKRGSRIRKWLTYMTLFIAASIIIGDLISVLYGLLSGDLNARFFLKSLTVLVIAGVIFGYYAWELRDERQAK